MPKGQIKNIKLDFNNVEKLKTVGKQIAEIKSGIRFWNLDKIWPTKLYIQNLDLISSELDEIIFTATETL